MVDFIISPTTNGNRNVYMCSQYHCICICTYINAIYIKQNIKQYTKYTYFIDGYVNEKVCVK